MIQRIQTIYLAFATLLSGLLLKGEIIKLITETGEVYRLTFRGISIVQGGDFSMVEKSLPLTILLAVVPFLFFVSIFIFKNRKLQIRATVLSTLLCAGALLLIGYYIFYAGSKFGATLIFNIKITFPAIGVILGYLAFRSILKDELLVKSYDRIR